MGLEINFFGQKSKSLSLKKNILGLICLVIIAVIFLAGLWPFNFSPENRVRWLKDQSGVEFYGQSLVFSTIPLFQSSTIPVKSFSIELSLQSITESGAHIGHIFSTFDEQGSETFFVGQWRSHLLLGKGIHGKKTYREIGIRDVLKKGDKRFVTITSGADETRIYVDGLLLKSSPKFQLFSMKEKPWGRILLGNAPTGNENWTGNLLSLAIYDRALTGEQVSQHFQKWMIEGKSSLSTEEGIVSLYLFDEHSGTLAHDSVGDHHLLIPTIFKVLKKTILVPPWEDFQLNRSYLMDILTNILGFIPFGFFFSGYLWMKKPCSTFRLLLTSLIIAACISLSIELIQAYLPTRNSQLTDVIANTLGAIIGAFLFSRYRNKLAFNP
jgi:glycopeptide antibiotics resistance protein